MSATIYLLYAPALPVERFSSPAKADQRRRELIDLQKIARLFALNPDRHIWREWISVSGKGAWHDVERHHVPVRVMSFDKP